MRGLGDLVKVVTDTLGIDQCDNCMKRQSKLNQLFPFKNPINPTEEEIEFLNDVFSWYKGLPIPMDKVDDLVKCEQLWLKLFRIKTQGCKSCGATYQNNYMNDLKRLWENL